MNRALFVLMKLRLRGAVRKVARTVKRPKGALLLLLSVGLFAMAVLPSLLMTGEDQAKLEIRNPWFLRAEALFVFWLLMMITGRTVGGLHYDRCCGWDPPEARAARFPPGGFARLGRPGARCDPPEARAARFRDVSPPCASSRRARPAPGIVRTSPRGDPRCSSANA